MKILFVSATEMEIADFMSKLTLKSNISNNLKLFKFEKHHIYILITGVGMVNMTYQLCKTLQKQSFDVVYNFGIAGSYNESLKIGELVNVMDDIFIEIGTREEDLIIPFENTNSNIQIENYIIRNEHEAMFPLNSVLNVSGITVNTVNTSTDFISKTKLPYQIDVESMEGAAFMLCCQEAKVTYFQIRAISNYIKPRSEASWDIRTALYELNDLAFEIIRNS